MTTTGLPTAVDYKFAAAQMRVHAAFYRACAASVESQPEHLTFAAALAERCRHAYESLADAFVLASEQAEQIAEQIPLVFEAAS